MKETLEKISFLLRTILNSAAKFPDRLQKLGRYLDFSIGILLQLLEMIGNDKRKKGPKNKGYGYF